MPESHKEIPQPSWLTEEKRRLENTPVPFSPFPKHNLTTEQVAIEQLKKQAAKNDSSQEGSPKQI